MNKEFIPVMLTPFKADGEVDYNGLTQLTEYYLQSGAKGLFANCLSSEMYELNETERLQVVSHVVKVANGAVPVVATGTLSKSPVEQADFIKKMYDTGTQAVIIITAMMADEKEPEGVFNQRVFDLFDNTGAIPFGFYECPKPYKRLISAEQLKMFVDTGRVTYHKDTSLNLESVKSKIAAGSGHKFGLYDAYMVNAIDSMKAGAAGLSCIQGNYFPRLVVWLCENYYKPGLSDEVEKVRNFFSEHMEIMHDVYPFSAKYCLQKQGINITTTVRTQGKPFSFQVKAHIDALYENYQILERDLQLAENGIG